MFADRIIQNPRLRSDPKVSEVAAFVDDFADGIALMHPREDIDLVAFDSLGAEEDFVGDLAGNAERPVDVGEAHIGYREGRWIYPVDVHAQDYSISGLAMKNCNRQQIITYQAKDMV